MGYLSSNKNKQVIIVDDDDQNAQLGSSSRRTIPPARRPNAQSGSSSRGPVGPDPNAQTRTSLRRGPIISQDTNLQAGLPSRAVVGRDPNNVQFGSLVGGPSSLGPNVQFGSSSRGLIGYGSNSQIGSSSRGPISHGTNIQFGSYESSFHILEDRIPHQSNTLFGSTTAPNAHESNNIQFGSSSSRGVIFRDSNFQLGSSSWSGPSGHESNFQLGSSRGVASRDDELNNMNGHNGSIYGLENDPSFPDDVDCTLRLGMSSGTSSAKVCPSASGTSSAARPNTRNRFSTGPPYPQMIDNHYGAVNHGGPTQGLNRWGLNMFRYEAAERMNNVEFHGNYGMRHGCCQTPQPLWNPPLGSICPLPPPVPLLFRSQPLPPMFSQRPNDILGLVNANLAAGLISNPLNNGSKQRQEAKRCMACHTTSTPLWRNGPAGPKTLCNACGIRYKKETKKFFNNHLGLD